MCSTCSWRESRKFLEGSTGDHFMTPDIETRRMQQQIQDLQNQVAVLQGCIQQLFNNDSALCGGVLATFAALVAGNSNNAALLGALNGGPVMINPVTNSPTPQPGFGIQRFPGSFGV
jgi:hypothetical protein